MKHCIDCEYFSPSNYCNSPSNGESPIDGKSMVRFATMNRSIDSAGSSLEKLERCGPDANFFKEKQPASIIKRKWWKFWRTTTKVEQ